ncbi:hemagglutinin/amebocyte aggregation factor-like [Haliotis rufescens]|uniref:hemagglutinin/amebocyte aggregation factor-like n=1 Tax=Haliotis rufescens TaxID=6454 RepID=UPI00201EDCD2|nr:hemagglutinin/amebocyte aggregation factor-like [Haliotis rufescens]
MMFPTAFLLLSLVSVVTSKYVNDFDKRFNYECPSGKSIASWKSYNSVYHGDRRYKFTCQNTPGLGYCQWHNYVNRFDQPISFRCYNGVITGVGSYHNSYYEDRRFSFNCCSLYRKRLVRCGWTGFVNNWNKDLNFRMPEGHFLKGVSSIHNNRYEDRRWKFETCAIQ